MPPSLGYARYLTHYLQPPSILLQLIHLGLAPVIIDIIVASFFLLLLTIAVLTLRFFFREGSPEPDSEVASAYIQKYGRLHDRGHVCVAMGWDWRGGDWIPHRSHPRVASRVLL